MPNYQASKAVLAGHMQSCGNASVYDDKVTVGTALVLNDTIDLIRLPAGVRLETLAFPVFSDFDSGTTLVISIGYRKVDPSGSLTDVPAYFGTGHTFLRAASANNAPYELAFDPVYFPEDVYIYATVTTAQTGGGTGSITTRAIGAVVGPA